MRSNCRHKKALGRMFIFFLIDVIGNGAEREREKEGRGEGEGELETRKQIATCKPAILRYVPIHTYT